MPPAYLFHPIAVHFAVALLVTGGLFKALAVWRKNQTADSVSLWLLRAASPLALVTAALGFLAARTAPHVPAAWETMYDHKIWGLSTAGTALILWIVEEMAHRQRKVWQVWLARALWLAVVALVFATADAGGDLVFQYGVGVAAAPHL